MSEDKQAGETARREREFEALLYYLRQSRGFDFTSYKRASLMRRVGKRMQTVKIEAFADYMDYLEVHPEEFGQLFNTVLINVTAFFRDPPAWEFLAEQCLPKLLAAKKTEPIRVWCAGCASGQEAYSIAMLLAEALGPEAFCDRVKIYATDVDEEALNVARLASYSENDLEAVDPALRRKYFEPRDSRYLFRADLRRSVIFGRHDLLQDAPISQLDLLLCRNTLMYFNAEAQTRILARFHFALNGDNGGGSPGYLFLGRAEMLLTHGNLFAPLEPKSRRIFVKVPLIETKNRILAMANQNGNPPPRAAATLDRLQELAMDESPVPRMIIDANGTLAHVNRKMRQQFSINAKDIGRPLRDLEISYRPVELRSAIEQAYVEHRAITQPNVERRLANGETQYLDVIAAPLSDETGTVCGASVQFLDVTRYQTMAKELQQSRDETQSSNQDLQASNEELETTNEELQSANEELESTNEELQSTNEELETMNEELQSANEELETVNTELRERTEQLNRTNSFLASVLSSLRSGAVVLDGNLNVEVWNDRAADLWGLRPDEVRGQSLFNLDIGLPIAQIRDPIRACANGASQGEERVLEATTRRGKKIRCRVSVRPLASAGPERRGAILMMDEVEV